MSFISGRRPTATRFRSRWKKWACPTRSSFVAIGKGEQFKPKFLAISPNNRIPAIVDPEGPDGEPISIFESGAILIYLGEKFGQFYPEDPRTRVAVNEWLFWQMANVGPIFGQNNHFRTYAKEKLPYAITRFVNETHRLFGVLDRRLDDREFVAGDYSIADMALSRGCGIGTGAASTSTSSRTCKRWHDAIAARPAVVKGLGIKAPADYGPRHGRRGAEGPVRPALSVAPAPQRRALFHHPGS